jgi:two-component system, LytTR family, sensor kinase
MVCVQVTDNIGTSLPGTMKLLTPPPVQFDDRLLRLVGIPVVGFLMPMLFFGGTIQNGLVAYLPMWISSTAHTLVYWEGTRFIYFQTRRWFPEVAQTMRRLLWLTGLTLLLSAFFSLFVCYGLNVILHGLFPNKPGHIPTILEEYKATLIPLVICLSIYECISYFRQLQAALLEAEQLKQANLQSQLETLKNQVNPHFLFNSLNTLTALIPEDPALAVRFVQKLAKVYRYILEIRELQTVSLADELSALRAYTFLLQIRFGDNLHIHFDLPADRLCDQVVPLSLQMLVENAVKHNVISTHRPLTIRVFLRKDRLIVQNNLQRKGQTEPDAADESTGLGLQNIRNQYQLLAGERVDVIVTTQQFAVSLPLLTSSVYEPAHH